MDDARRLGQHAAQTAPVLGSQCPRPSPADTAVRGRWEDKAASIAAYREMYGYDHPDDPMAPSPPGKHRPAGRLAPGFRRPRPGRPAGRPGFADGQLWLARDAYAAQTAWCSPALKIPILAAFTTPMKNRAFRAVSWGRCRSTWARCRTQGRFSAVIAVCGQARAGNGAGGFAGRGHGEQPAAGQHVDPRPPASVLQPVAAAEDQRRGRQVLQRGTQLVGAGPGQQLIMAGCQDGADARDAQLHGGPAGCADPAAHRAGRDGQAGGDGPVPVPASGRGQGLPDQPGGVGAARQQTRRPAPRG